MLLTTLLLTACGDGRFTYKPLSEFNIEQDALKNKAEIEFLYFSGGPAKEDGQDFLYQYLVISKETGDTIRVLSPDFISPEAMPPNYISAEGETAIDRAIVKSLGYKKGHYKRVICNTEFADAESQDYPVVIGFFGYVSGDAELSPESEEAVDAVMDSLTESNQQ